MVGGRVQRVEAVPLRLDVRPVGECEPHATEDLDRAILELGDRMQRAHARGLPGQRGVDAGEGRPVRVREQRGLALVERGGDGGAHVVEQFSDARLVVLRHVLHPLAHRRERAGLAEELDARLFDGGFIAGLGDGGERLGAELFELLVHVGGVVKQHSLEHAVAHPRLWKGSGGFR